MTNFEEICIVDDSPAPRTITLRLCNEMLPAIPVRVFETADHALGYLETSSCKCRVIFLDLDMPDKNGWEFLEHYMPCDKESVYILSSTECEEERRKASLHKYVEDFIPKPITKEKLSHIFSHA